MRASRLIGPMLVAALSFAATLALRHRDGLNAQAAAAVSQSQAQAPAKARHREESAFAEVRKCLRNGDLDGARAILSSLGERDPVAFFELLSKLPGFPGLEDIIRSSAERLPWNQPEITRLLNGIGPHQWRDLAWGSYVAPRSGIIPDKEILSVAGKADDYQHLAAISKVMEDAARERPDSFMTLLNEMGGTSVREEFVRMVMPHHPELAEKLFKSIPDGSDGCNYDRAYILQVRSIGQPTAENLLATLADVGDRGVYSSDFAPLCAFQAFRHASAEEKVKIIESIRGLPDVARNRMLGGPLLYEPKEVSPQDFARGVAAYTSGFLQQEALERWIKEQPEFDTKERGWIAELPTEKLRSQAARLLDEKAAAPKDKAGP